jgi:hypothetical protein
VKEGNVLVYDTSSPWHDRYQVLGQVEDSVAGVSSSMAFKDTTYMLTSKTYSSVSDNEEGKKTYMPPLLRL